jgi:hypothetical protein
MIIRIQTIYFQKGYQFDVPFKTELAMKASRPLSLASSHSSLVVITSVNSRIHPVIKL